MAEAIKILVAAALCAGLTMSCAPAASRAGKGAAPEETAGAPAAPAPAPLPGAAPEHGRRPVPDAIGSDEDIAFGLGLEGRAEFEQLDGRARGFEPGIAPPPERPDLLTPVPGGKATVYIPRGFLDDAVAEMVRLNPLGGDGRGRRLFDVTDSTHRRLEFTMAGRVTRANGQRATALDFVELWSRFIKSRPAQGLALFRNVQGVENFINGKDPLVNGWNAADERTVRIRFAKPDPLAFHRMNTSKLAGGPFMMGAYYSGGSRGNEMRLLPNKHSPLDTAFLAECIVQMGGDPDPLASFAAGKYSAAALYLAADIETAKTEFERAGKAFLHKLPSDRYFLACKSEDAAACRFVRSVTDGADMLNLVKAEGEAITSVTTPHDAAGQTGRAPPPELPKPFRVIYRDDDPISKTVAEKISADLGAAGVATETAGHNAEKYETALVRGTYDCAVGWVTEAALENLTEQLHFASMWFNDETDPMARLRDYKEIPLFSVNNYMLLREDTRLYQNRLNGMWVDSGAD